MLIWSTFIFFSNAADKKWMSPRMSSKFQHLVVENCCFNTNIWEGSKANDDLLMSLRKARIKFKYIVSGMVIYDFS